MAVDPVPPTLAPAVRRLARRLTLGLFLDTWPRWAGGALLAAGCVALLCRLLLPGAAPYLAWLLAVPIIAAIPAIVVTLRRAYGPGEVIALADALSGGGGLVLALSERRDEAWEHAPQITRASHLKLPRMNPWRRLAVLVPAFAFLLVALALPQRAPAFVSSSIADEIAADLSARLADLRAQEAVTPEEEQQLEEEIERVRRGAQERMDAAAWEAADAVQEKLEAKSAARRDSERWAQDALSRYMAAAADGLDPSNASDGAAQSELADALDALAKTGALANLPAQIQSLMSKGGKFPTDAAALRQLAGMLAEYLEGAPGIGELATLGGAGRFDSSEFATESGPDGDGLPGRGGVNRGRADAEMTWGEESRPADRFKAEALPPGFLRGPDDWAPIVRLPNAPDAAPQEGTRSASRTYRDETGQAAWRRTLSPRHQSAVKKYFGE